MRIPRIFHPTPLLPLWEQQQFCELSEDGANHVARVLRMRAGDEVVLFDGTNYVFTGKIVEIDKKNVRVQLVNRAFDDKESPLNLHLGQVMSRGERMEFTIQKSVELGVKTITPLFSERCGVKLDEKRLAKKVQQWQKIAIAACEQCGRNVVPTVRTPMNLDDWCEEEPNALKLNLHPRAQYSIKTLPPFGDKNVRLLIGSEGGLSAQEIAKTVEQGFTEIQLGPRVLRTETAALTAISCLQICFGDLA